MGERFPKQPAAGTLTGTEILMIAQRSTSVAYTATTLSMQASDNSLNDSANQFVIEGFQAGDLIDIDGFTGNAVNNKPRVALTVAAGKITFGADGDDIVDDAAGESVTIAKLLSRRVRLSELDAYIAP